MIRAMIFDLDGTLVQTERLKAMSYARAAAQLSGGRLTEEKVIEAFKDVVGLSRQEVAMALIERFGLEEAVRGRMAGFGVATPWQAFVQMRLPIYEAMLADPEVISNNQWPYNVALLKEARRTGCKVGLATMSHCSQVRRILEVLDLTHAFDFVASRDDVEHGKPDPEIYLLVGREARRCPERMSGHRGLARRRESSSGRGDVVYRSDHALHPRGPPRRTASGRTVDRGRSGYAPCRSRTDGG